MQYSSSFAGLTPELAELHLSHMSRERLLRPRSLEYFFGCPLQNFVLNSYPYTTNELLRQIGAFTTLKHLSLLNSPLITGTEFRLSRHIQGFLDLVLSTLVQTVCFILMHFKILNLVLSRHWRVTPV